MYEMEGSTLIGNWIWINVAFNSRNLNLQDIHTRNDFRNKINQSKLYVVFLPTPMLLFQ